MSTTTPTARVLSVRELRHTRVVSIACPFCRRTHQHGWPLEAPDVGLRSVHCHRPNGEPVRSYRVQVDVGGAA